MTRCVTWAFSVNTMLTVNNILVKIFFIVYSSF